MYVAPNSKPPTNPPAVTYQSVSRLGFTVTELIVAATLLVTVMSVVTPLTVRSHRLWQDSRYHRLAIDELTNHLERLASVGKSTLATAVGQLALSPQIQAALPSPVLSAETLADESGTRVILQLNWNRLGESLPVTLVGWIDPLPASTSSTDQEESR